MNRKDLQESIVKAQEKLQELELKALKAERVAKVAKAKAKQLKLEHRRARKAAKAAKRVAAALAEEARAQCRVLEKAECRLAKALSKLRPSRSGLLKPTVVPPAHPPVLGKSSLPKASAGKARPVPIVRRSAGNRPAYLARPHAPEGS